jgi:lycopene cyclase domain-containing protein
MNSHYTYLLIDIATIICPFLYSFEKKRVNFSGSWRYLLPATALTGLFFIIWDAWFTHIGVWGFNEKYIIGVEFAGLPIEEWLFFLVVPYSCVFIYDCLLYFRDMRRFTDRGWLLFPIVGSMLLLTSFFFIDKAYTFSASFLAGIGCILVFLLRKKLPSFRADAFWLMYLISFIPFFIVNGILTALPVVVYNNAENVDIRATTIPVEDFVYSLLLLLCNVAGMEYFRGRRLKEQVAPVSITRI